MEAQLTSLTGAAWAQCGQVTALALAVWAIVRVAGQSRPHLASVLWLVVLLKCLTPPVLSSPTGVFCWLRMEKAGQYDGVANAAASIAPMRAVTAPPLPGGDQESRDDVVVRLSPADAPLSDLVAAEPPSTISQSSWTAIVLPGCALIWLIGSLLYASLLSIRWFGCWRRLRLAGESRQPEMDEMLQELRRQLGVRQRVRLLVTGSSVGPAVVGLWRPLIILPAALVRGKTPAELAPLVAHELIHIRRGDLWIALLQTLAVVVWWFHPLVHLASRLLTREAERCCDEGVIAHLGCDPAAYARSLLEVLALKTQLRPVPAFPGVRPLDVTSQRLERIMNLRQGCLKRTPWWCSLAMLLLAAAALPGGALWTGAQEPSRRSAHGNEWPVDAGAGAAQGQPPLFTRTYEVADLLEAAQLEPGESEEAAKITLATLVRMTAEGRWKEDAGGSDQSDWLPSMEWLADKLVVRQTKVGHERIAEQLATLREHGFAQVAVEVRIVSGPVVAPNSAASNWRLIGDSASTSGSDEQPPVARGAGTFSRAATVVESHLPALLGIIDDSAVQEFLNAAQDDSRSNVMQAPKVTLFNGQHARIEDSVQRPYVVGVKPTESGGYEPQIRVFTEGTSIRLRPEVQRDGQVQLDLALSLSDIRDVQTATFPLGPGKEPVSVQVPEVATTRIETSAELRVGQTLAISIPAAAKSSKSPSSKKRQPLCVLVTVRRGAPDAAQRKAPAANALGRERRRTEDSAGRSDARLVEKIYAVADLVIPFPFEPVEVVAFDEAAPAGTSPRAVAPDYQSLVDLITTTIAPDSWIQRGGEGTVSNLPNRLSLLVRQTEDVHEQVADLFEQLRCLQDVQILSTVEGIELRQAEFRRWATSADLPALKKLAERNAPLAAVSSASWDELRVAAEATVTWRLPRITAFNGQAFDLSLARPKSPPSGVISRLQIQPLVAADFRFVRLSIGAGLENGKDRPTFDPSRVRVSKVPRDHLVLVDLDPSNWNTDASGATTGDKRRLCLIKPQVMVVSGQPYARVLSPRAKE